MTELQSRLLDRIAASTNKSILITGRELFESFGYSRRTSNNCFVVDRFLEEHKLEVDPNYNDVWIDNSIELREKKKAKRRIQKDPIKRIAALESANNKPIVISNDADLNKAITIMMRDNFSQLPVTTGGNNLCGFISWETIGVALVNGVKSTMVKDYVNREIKTLLPETPLLHAIRAVYESGFVVVVNPDRTVRGIITTTDISSQFLAFTEPFLLIEEIENHIRRLLDGKLHLEEVQSICNLSEYKVEHLDDLAFGDYIRIIQNPSCWDRLGLCSIDRKTLVELLNKTREIRNDIMHFEPAGVSQDNYNLLKKVSVLLQKLSKYHCAE